ncbi:sporulation protein YtxC [Desulfotomaculum nigrificans CO-1-SRB]|uniref:Sporulation protein YtxC n=1 Tax=Desulfotomaculum nigrificans (strain DSM 14880 / VKM B-2319 / CO-1-SRB) TaxID=868595 RepID=F6B303_DESCC|nr:putative sporulation protein YtxC [Desulfotomaculum nigrificans]AEF93907.1 sporulation protein YtxC [Desulfotomaculum nigrificans CO-1-SRB]
MPQCLSIGATQHIDWLKDRLGRKLRFNEGNDIYVNLRENPVGNITFISCDFNGTVQGGRQLDDELLFRHFVADIISDLILNHWEKAMLAEIIRENYYYFNEGEKQTIFQYCLQYTNGEKNIPGQMDRLDRKNYIIKKLVDYLGQNDSIVIDGFIRFRLKEYINDIKETVDQAVDEFLMDREYREFIQLLQYFVEMQEPKVNLVNVLVNQRGVYKLYDENNVPISSEFLEGYILDVIDNEINYEDLLISALITIAPNKIVFHGVSPNKPDTAMETIKHVFTDRVSVCSGCKLCQKNQQ